MSEDDLDLILRELWKWAEGEYEDKVTWEKLSAQFGFSRQALQSRAEIKAGYLVAKKNLAEGAAKTRGKLDLEVKDLQRKVFQQEEQVRILTQQIEAWRLRWQRIAFHIRSKGLQMVDIDRPIPLNSKFPNQKEAEAVLGAFDKPLPPIPGVSNRKR